MAANNIYIQVDFNSQTAQQNVNALNTAIGQTGPVAEKSSKQATAGLNSFSLSIQQVNKEFQQMTSALAGLGIARAFQSMVQSGSELNRVILAMQSFTGSAEDAAKVFEQVRAIAAQSPFKMKDLEETARQLLGFGFAAKNVPTILKTISDQVARMGGSMEDVNGIVTLFGRMMTKDFVGAMDVIRKLPSEGIPVLRALAAEMQKTLGHPVNVEDARNAIKEGLLDPLQTVRLALEAMSKAGGFGGMIADFAIKMKNLGDVIDEVRRRVMADNGFGKAFNNLANEISGVLAVLGGFVDYLLKLPDPTKNLIVNITAGAVAFTALGTALTILTTLVGPLLSFTKALAGLVAELAIANPELLLTAVVIGAIGTALYQTVPEIQKFVDTWVGKFTGMFSGLADAGKKFAADLAASLGEGIKKGNAFDNKPLFDKAMAAVAKFGDEAQQTLLRAFLSPVEAIDVKYAAEFKKLEDQFQPGNTYANLAEGQRQQLRDALSAAKAMEVLAAETKKAQQAREEATKAEVEHVKGSYQAQIDYIEAMDAQDLRSKVAAIDKITDLRIESAQKVASVEDSALFQTFTAQEEYFKTHRDELTKLGVDVDAAIAARQKEMTDKIKANDQRAVDETQQYRLEGWKKANDAIIEDQKRIFESFKSVFDQIFDAITGKNPGKAMADVFKKLVLDQAKDMFSSSAAGLATAAAGYGYPEGGITRGTGILSQLFQHGMAPRPPGPPPEQYNPATTNEVFKPLEDGANRFDESTIRFAVAVDRLAAAGGGQPSEGYAERMAGGDVSSAITRASQATGVPESLLRTVAQNESAFNPFAVSRKGAEGLMQLMPPTQQDWGVTNPFDVNQNAMAGAQQLKRLLIHYGGDVPTALAAYNWGQGNVDKAIASGGAFPDETQRYVKRIMGQLPSAQGGADLGGAVFQMPPSGGIAAPDIGDLTAPSAIPTFQAPQYQLPAAWAIPQLSQSDIDKYSVGGGATPTTIERAKQAGAMGTILAGIVGGGKGGGLGGGLTKQMSSMDFSKLGQLFGIGTAAPIGGAVGGTTVQSVLTSKAVGALATMGGMMLFSQGLQKRSALLTTMGGGLAGVGGVISNPTLMANLAAGPGGLAAGLGAGAAAGVGLGLFASGVQRGGGAGLGMDIGGGALAGAGIGFMAGGPLGAAIGAGIGAAAGLITGVVRLFVQTEQEKIRAQVKQVYGIDISNRQILSQIQQVVDQNYGGNVAVGIRSQEVQNLVRLYALSTGQAANMPRPMYNATIAQATGGLQLQPVYQGGVQVQNPYTGVTTYQYQTAVTAAQGLMPSPGSGLGVPGGAGLINYNFAQLSQQQIISTIQTNPAAITQASAAAATAGDSRLSTTQAMQEPLTLLT